MVVKEINLFGFWVFFWFWFLVNRSYTVWSKSIPRMLVKNGLVAAIQNQRNQADISLFWSVLLRVCTYKCINITVCLCMYVTFLEPTEYVYTGCSYNTL